MKVYGNELCIKIEELNLLERDDNCIESSTAIGFCIEEFIVSKLITYTSSNTNNDIKISRANSKTINSSFDCYSKYQNNDFLINIKVDRTGNNAVAAFEQLHNDYCLKMPDSIKHYMVLKLYYSINRENKKIKVNNVDAYFLEEINFLLSFKQDHRSWSKIFNPNSGRIQVTKKDLIKNRLKDKDISYKNTKKMLSEIYIKNKKNT